MRASPQSCVSWPGGLGRGGLAIACCIAVAAATLPGLPWEAQDKPKVLTSPHDEQQYMRELCTWKKLKSLSVMRRRSASAQGESSTDEFQSREGESETSNSNTPPRHGAPCDPCQWIGRNATGRCAEHCTCTSRGRWRCCRMRKEFSLMSDAEAQRYIRAYLKLTTQQPYKRVYDAMVAKHTRLFMQAIHMWPQFWPWHRYFILKLENVLRRIDCRVTLPYWDFTHNWVDPWASIIWTKRRLGGSGTEGSVHCVTDGPFARGKWRVTPSANSTCLTRSFDPWHLGISPRVLTLGTYVYPHASQVHLFEKIVSVYMHSWVHITMGGIMATHKSANEPAFWMLHSFADKLWGNWQQRGPRFTYTPFSKMNVTLREQEGNDSYTVADMLDLGDLPGAEAPDGADRVAVCYDGIVTAEAAYDGADMHGLPVPRNYAVEYSPHRSLTKLLSSILRNKKETGQFYRMRKDPFKRDFDGF